MTEACLLRGSNGLTQKLGADEFKTILEGLQTAQLETC
jgi:hypothetical protein